MVQKKIVCSSHYQLIGLIFLLHTTAPARGDYVLRVRILSYSNPTNRCASCGENRGCCDRFETNNCFFSEDYRCDNRFFFCLRPLGTPVVPLQDLQETVPNHYSGNQTSVEARARLLRCLQPPAAFVSSVNTDGEAIEFTAGSTFLGLPNPLEFRVRESEWEGIQFYYDVIDDDNENQLPHDVVDSFITDVSTAAGSITDFPFSLGNYQIASTDLSIEVECLPGYSGERCTANRVLCGGDIFCDEGEVCIPSDSPSGFSCANTAIKMEVITADFDVGAGNHNNTNTTSGSIDVAGVVGAVVGSVALVAIIVAVVATATIVLVVRRRTKKGIQVNVSSDSSTTTTLSNPIYGSSQLLVIESESDERELDNPIYGVSDEDILCSKTEPQDGTLYSQTSL